MHTSKELNISDFSLTVEGRSAAVVDLLPGFSRTTRLAIVSRTPGGAFGAATTVLAMVTAWYDELRRGVDEFFEYPDFFYFHLGDGGIADLGGLEIWPPHKQVALPARAQDVLAAITDRAVEYLLVEDGPLSSALVLRETKNSLPRHLRAAVAYGADGTVESSDVTVTGSARSERHVIHAIDDSVDLPADVRAARRDLRRRLGRPEAQPSTCGGLTSMRQSRCCARSAIRGRTLPGESAAWLTMPSPPDWFRSAPRRSCTPNREALLREAVLVGHQRCPVSILLASTVGRAAIGLAAAFYFGVRVWLGFICGEIPALALEAWWRHRSPPSDDSP